MTPEDWVSYAIEFHQVAIISLGGHVSFFKQSPFECNQNPKERRQNCDVRNDDKWQNQSTDWANPLREQNAGKMGEGNNLSTKRDELSVMLCSAWIKIWKCKCCCCDNQHTLHNA
jgi:hypothetical protein